MHLSGFLVLLVLLGGQCEEACEDRRGLTLGTTNVLNSVLEAGQRAVKTLSKPLTFHICAEEVTIIVLVFVLLGYPICFYLGLYCQKIMSHNCRCLISRANATLYSIMLVTLLQTQTLGISQAVFSIQY